MWAVILHPISRFVAALVIMLVVFGARMYHSLSAFDYPARPDGNNGQITIDFGGQYLLGALLLEGHGREMYHKRHQWATAWKSYPLASEDPNAEKHDAQELVASFMGSDHPEWSKVGGIVWAPFAAHDPFTRAVLAHEAGPLLTPELLEKINSVTPDHGLGGSLYPPLQGFVTAPLAKLGPHRAYRVTQWLMGVLGVLGGVAVSAAVAGQDLVAGRGVDDSGVPRHARRGRSRTELDADAIYLTHRLDGHVARPADPGRHGLGFVSL